MNNHTDLLNFIANKIEAETYLEVGVCNLDHNYNHIKVDEKVGVDPDPLAKAPFECNSDFFFAHIHQLIETDSISFDLIFIDGLHHAEQVRKDILNAWKFLNDNGVLVLHDANPPSEATTCVPRGRQREWCGNVFQTILQIESPSFFTADFDYGCTIIRKTHVPLRFHDMIISWQDFDIHRKALLNLKTSDEIKEIIESWT